jgi:hypothetical protein
VLLVYVLLAAAVGAAPADRPRSRAPAHASVRLPTSYVERLQIVVREYGLQLLAARDASELDAIVERLLDDAACRRALLEVAAAPPPERMPTSGAPFDALVDSFVAEGVARFEGSDPGLFRQCMELSIEFLHRMPPVDRSALGTIDVTEPLDADARRALGSGLYSIAVIAGMMETGKSVRPGIGSLLLNRWLDGSRWMLGQIDSLQAAFDSSVTRFPEPTRADTLRVSYRDGEDSLGQPALFVWVVLRDGTPRERRAIGGNRTIASAVVAAARSVGREEPVLLRARLASEPDPSAWDLQT